MENSNELGFDPTAYEEILKQFEKYKQERKKLPNSIDIKKYKNK